MKDIRRNRLTRQNYCWYSDSWSVCWLYLKMWRTFWQQNKQDYLLHYRLIL